MSVSTDGDTAPPAKKRSYGVSCLACREKKISCNGAKPSCRGCLETSEECTYLSSARPLRRLRKSATETVDVVALQDKVQRLEQKLHRVEELLAIPLSSRPPSPGPVDPAIVRPGAVYAGPSRRPGTISAVSHARHSSTSGAVPIAGLSPSVGDKSGSKWRLTVDMNGNVIYHGLTSLEQAEDMTDLDSTSHTAPASAGMLDPNFAVLFQALAVAKHISVAPELGKALIDCYFGYQVTGILDRSIFLRDMALGGPFFSDFLLMTIYASANRIIDGMDGQERRTQGDIFARLARDMLTNELEGPSKITTAQGLLLLSERECALGRPSQGWNYAGLAFRLIHDLGIHLNPELVAGSSKLSEDDLANRDRLFWSAFVWDKVLSLAFGREPSFFPRRGRNPSTLPDLIQDDGPWDPYFADPVNCPPQLLTYHCPHKRRIEAFRFTSNLTLILHDLILEVYSAESELSDPERVTFLARTRYRLESVWETIPGRLKWVPGNQAPPPWVFQLLMLYYASWILLYRPFFEDEELARVSGNVAFCLEHSKASCALFDAFGSLFEGRLPYLAIYSSFVAANFDLCVLRSDRSNFQLDALGRIRIWLEHLSQVSHHGNNIKRSLQSLYSQTIKIISTNLNLGASDAGQWILARYGSGSGGMFPSPATSAEGQVMEGMDFYDMLAPMY